MSKVIAIVLAAGKRMEVKRAPTYFGPVNLRIESAAATGSTTAKVEFTSDRPPQTLLVCLRHPENKLFNAVTVNDIAWKNFDAAKVPIRIRSPKTACYEITASYSEELLP